MLVIKRDGSGVPFHCNKIINAINKAFKEVDGEVFEGDTATDIALDIGKRVDASPTAVYAKYYGDASYSQVRQTFRNGEDDSRGVTGYGLQGTGLRD